MPEDIAMLMGDSQFHDASNLTQKELQKKINDMKNKQPQSYSPPMASPGGRMHHSQSRSQGRNVGEVVSQDPQAWQNESSVRHVGGAGNGANHFTYGPSQHSHGISTPPGQYTPAGSASPASQSHFRSEFRKPHGPMGIGAG